MTISLTLIVVIAFSLIGLIGLFATLFVGSRPHPSPDLAGAHTAASGVSKISGPAAPTGPQLSDGPSGTEHAIRRRILRKLERDPRFVPQSQIKNQKSKIPSL